MTANNLDAETYIKKNLFNSDGAIQLVLVNRKSFGVTYVTQL